MDLDSARFYRAYSTRGAKVWSIIGCLTALIAFSLTIGGAGAANELIGIIVGVLAVFALFCMFLIFIFICKSFVIAPNVTCVFSIITAIVVGFFCAYSAIAGIARLDNSSLVGMAWIFYIADILLFVFSFLSFVLGSYRKEFKNYLREARRAGLSSAQIHNNMARLKNGSITKSELYSSMYTAPVRTSTARTTTATPPTPRSTTTTTTTTRRRTDGEAATAAPSAFTRRAESIAEAPRPTVRPAPAVAPVATPAPRRRVNPLTDRGYPNMEAYFECKDTQGNRIKLREGDDGKYYDVQSLPYVKVGDVYRPEDL